MLSNFVFKSNFIINIARYGCDILFSSHSTKACWWFNVQQCKFGAKFSRNSPNSHFSSAHKMEEALDELSLKSMHFYNQIQ